MEYEKNDELYAIISVSGGTVHLLYTVNPDASCCQGTRDGLQLECYSRSGWNEPKDNPRLATNFWDVWSEWNGRVSGGITLYDDFDSRKWKLLREGIASVSPYEIASLEDGRYVVYDEV